MTKEWKIKPEIPLEFKENFSHIPPLVLQLLYNRGLKEKSEIESFLNTSYEEGLYSPFLFQDMEKAVARIWQAIESEEKIWVYGDYDADAVTANAVLQQTFSYLGKEVHSYIPDRFTEGYGVNLEAIESIKNQGAKIIITVDCGTNSVEAAEFCRKNGVDFIITDHHEIIGPRPEAFALINPKDPETKYPFSEITGVGVAFKLACGILQRAKGAELKDEAVLRLASTRSGSLGAYVPGWEKWLLDLVAVGTVADCHELVSENRTLVKYGLKVLAKTKWIGLRALCIQASLNFAKKKPDTYTLGFVVAPRLNAAGRLEHANIALELLLEKDPVSAQQKAAALEQINKRRQDITTSVLDEAREKSLALKERKVLALMGEDWPKGVVGLVAGKLAEEFKKPTFILSKQGLEATGSARGLGEFSVIEALKYSQDLLLRFGGHQQAAGLTLLSENFQAFYEKLSEYAEKNLTTNSEQLTFELEAQVSAIDLSLKFLKEIEKLEPFGLGNPVPKFLVCGLRVKTLKTVGSLNQHLQLVLEAEGKTFKAIAFSKAESFKTLRIGDVLDIATELLVDSWNGVLELKLKVLDVKIHPSTISGV
jgi:single-stranded-DNA-specific exonuclease